MNPLVPALVAGLLVLAPTPKPGGDTTIEGTERGNERGITLSNSSIVLKGDVKGGKSDGYRVKRPCWYEPGLDAEAMLKFQTDPRTQFARIKADDESFNRFVQQFKDKKGQPGRWWTPAYDTSHPQGAACWAELELFLFVPPDTTPPSGITFEQLAEIARAALTVPEPVIKLNPDVKSYVNLPTFVWLDNPGDSQRSVTATLPGIMSATVTATRQNITITSGTTDDRAKVVQDGCGQVGTPYVKGAAFTCGVQYLRASIDQPREVYELTVSSTWPVQVADRVVPFQFAPVEVSATRDVPVGEVQSNVRNP
ncbi:hypothetical protein [Nonomuraea cavernae]|uniref:hypothetical protein n=1 Tax=Nonomuraea cavernae TaxID=2045107 RepID=UPI0033D4FB62